MFVTTSVHPIEAGKGIILEVLKPGIPLIVFYESHSDEEGEIQIDTSEDANKISGTFPGAVTNTSSWDDGSPVTVKARAFDYLEQTGAVRYLRISSSKKINVSIVGFTQVSFFAFAPSNIAP